MIAALGRTLSPKVSALVAKSSACGPRSLITRIATLIPKARLLNPRGERKMSWVQDSLLSAQKTKDIEEILASDSTLAITEEQDDADVRAKYKPFLLDADTRSSDWVSRLELRTVANMAREDLLRTKSRLKVLVLYGSLRKRYVLTLTNSQTGLWFDF
jgi:hypothetical protein